MTMTKADLVETVADAADVPRKQADEVVQVILESIITALRRNEKVELRGFRLIPHPAARRTNRSEPENRRTGARAAEKDPLLQTRQAPQGRTAAAVNGGGRDSLRTVAARIRVDSRRT